MNVTHTDVPSEVVVKPLFVAATKRSVPGGFSMLFNRVFEWGYWARLADVERAVYPALGYCGRFTDDFEAEASIGELMELTGLGRTSVKKAIGTLIERGLIAVSVQGSGRTKSRYRLLVPVKEAENAHQADAGEERRKAKARAQTDDAPFTTGSRSRPPADRDRDPVSDAVAAPAPSPSRPAAGRDRAAQAPALPLDRKTLLAEEPLDEAAGPVVELCRVGVSPSVAARLVEDFDAEHLSAYLAAFRRNRADGRRYSAGWLVNAIREGWQIQHLRPPRAGTVDRPTPAEADPFERAWREAGELDDDAFESLRGQLIARCNDATARQKLIDADRTAAHLRAAVAEMLVEAGG